MNILLIGDIIGAPGRQAIKHLVPQLREKHQIDFVVANGENSAGGNGITKKTAAELLDSGIDVLTSGDHIWKNKDVLKILDLEQRILRPANYPEGAPGKGYNIFICSNNIKIAVINLMGRVFMSTIDCPFHTATKTINKILEETNIILVDFHAEATSEKIALGWHLDGRISCLAGTHTHVPTRDYRILPEGTAYISDLGMVGSQNSVIGVEKDAVLRRFLTQRPVRFQPAQENVWLNGIIVTIDPKTGKATSIKPVDEKFE